MKFQTKGVIVGVSAKNFTDKDGKDVAYFVITFIANDDIYKVNTRDKNLADKLTTEKMKEVIMQLEVKQNQQGYTKLTFAN